MPLPVGAPLRRILSQLGPHPRPAATERHMAALLTVHHARLSAELRSSIGALQASRARLAAAVDGARRELEHDLAGGARLQLASVRAQLAAAAGETADPELRALLAELGTAAEQAAETLDGAAHGIYPRQLVEHGLAAALRAGLGGSASIEEPQPLQRGPEESEAAVCFCCLEAAQNALKHAGAPSAVTVTVTLRQRDGDLRFAVHDDGDGFDVATARHGRGLANIRDRIEAVGGQVAIASGPERGTTVSGSVPWPPRRLSPARRWGSAAATEPPRRLSPPRPRGSAAATERPR